MAYLLSVKEWVRERFGNLYFVCLFWFPTPSHCVVLAGLFPENQIRGVVYESPLTQAGLELAVG